MPEPGLRLGGRPESMRDPGRQDLHDGVERILGAILAQVGALRRQTSRWQKTEWEAWLSGNRGCVEVSLMAGWQATKDRVGSGAEWEVARWVGG